MATTGYLETPDSPYLVSSIFGRSAPDPLVDSNNPSGLGPGGHNFGVVTVDQGPGPTSPEAHVPHWRNMLSPSHSEAFWILLLAAIAVGLLGASGSLRVGSAQFKARAGKA